ncbi:MAG TPA: serine/threonine-protein kinase [Polyangia bacterium]|nr:serine/threonine-protein kinase [Polyangia bacterium]
MRKPISFGKYHLLERINVGGMAEVFKAKTFGVEGFERLLAVKRILPNIAEDQEFIRMFIDEAKIAVQLTHANICQIFDLGRAAGAYFIALELVHGKDLRVVFDRCRQRPVDGSVTMPVGQTCYVVMKVCEGLDYAHNKRDAQGHELHLVHRDVSPQNVLISYDGEVKLIDFGIAKAAGKVNKTEAGILKGKFGYMSPEQVRGLPLDRRSDIFSVGIVLYELLTGERLFWGETDFSTLEKVRNAEILPPSTYNRRIPDELERIVLKALAKDVEDRYQNAIDLHDDLQAFVYAAGELCQRKDLAAWMKRTFATELEAENLKMEAYRQFTPELAGSSDEDRRRPRRPPPPPSRAFHVGQVAAAGGGPPPAPRPTGRGQAAAGRAAMAVLAVAEAPAEPELDEIHLDWADEDETNVYDGPGDMDDAGAVGPPGALDVPEEMVLAERSAPPTNAAEISLSPDGSPVPAKPRNVDRKPVSRNGSSAISRSTARLPARAPVSGVEVGEMVAASGTEKVVMPAAVAEADRPPSLLGKKASAAARDSRSRLPLVLGLVLLAGVALALVYALVLRTPRPGGLLLITDPARGVRLSLDGRSITPDAQGRVEVPPGSYVLSAESEGFKLWQDRITIQAGEVTSRRIVLDPTDAGFLVTSEPAGAKVSLDGKALAGVTPLRQDDVPAGAHVLLVQLGERSQARPITLEAGKVGEFHIALAPAAPQAPEPAPPAPAVKPAVSAPHHGDSHGDAHGERHAPAPAKPQGAATTLAQLAKALQPPAESKPEAAAPGSLRIGSRPWTYIIVDGKETGLTTPQVLPLSSGLHRIKLVNPDSGIEKSFTVEIHSGESLTKTFNNLADEGGGGQ